METRAGRASRYVIRVTSLTPSAFGERASSPNSAARSSGPAGRSHSHPAASSTALASRAAIVVRSGERRMEWVLLRKSRNCVTSVPNGASGVNPAQ